ncbi:MAG: nicotinate-nucleotide adenylyltransferase [Bacteroidales bacterium]|jgi:nicotinate-nucleotide adenylyltransferase|nr:nicotinate-nucleotide adenylyltransferase [Bacteroidales bacterium]
MKSELQIKKTGLYFGSFNPIHNGHLILAEHILQNSDLSQIWFVVSPQNPLKNRASLLDNRNRLAMVRLAIDDNEGFLASDIEFSLPQPSYTINTLVYLSEKYPLREFSLILGEDNLENFNKWRNYTTILEYYKLYIYPRRAAKPSPLAENRNVIMIDAPQIDISSSFIRENIKSGKSIRYLVPEKVRLEIEKGGYYR